MVLSASGSGKKHEWQPEKQVQVEQQYGRQ
jgi:hypothetical protein